MGLNAREAEGQSAVGREFLQFTAQLATTVPGFVEVPFNCDLDSIQIAEPAVGVGGTSMSLALVRRRVGTADVVLASTPGVLTLAAGAGACIDSSKRRDAVATPAGCTKPVLDITKRRLKKGDQLVLTPTQTGAYTTAPTFSFTAIVRPTL